MIILYLLYKIQSSVFFKDHVFNHILLTIGVDDSCPNTAFLRTVQSWWFLLDKLIQRLYEVCMQRWPIRIYTYCELIERLRSLDVLNWSTWLSLVFLAKRVVYNSQFHVRFVTFLM